MVTRSAISEIDLKVKSTIRHELDNGDMASATILQIFLSDVLAGGINANQANRAWAVEDHVILNGGIQTFRFSGETSITSLPDIGSGAGFDALGQETIFEEIVCLIIKQTEGPGRIFLDFGASGVLTYDWISETGMQNPTGYMKPGGVRMWFQPATDALPANTFPPFITKIEFTLGATGGDTKVSVFVLARHDDEESSSSSASTSSSSSESTSSQSTASSSSTST